MLELNKIYLGKNLDVLKTFPDNSIDSVVTDPPYGLGKEPNVYEVMKSWIETGYHEIKGKGFMGKEWDSFVPQPIFWKEVYRVLKPGGFVLSFAGTRTYDWMVMAIRFAGFEIRDMIGWLYGSGFPKSLDISKAIESKLLNGKSNSVSLRKTEQDGDGESYQLKGRNNGIMGEEKVFDRKEYHSTTSQAKQWQGFGTALKPAIEPIVLARKPVEGTVAENVLKYGVGGLNIDGCRVGTEEILNYGTTPKTNVGFKLSPKNTERPIYDGNGRFPANVIHDGSDEVVRLFPNTVSSQRNPTNNKKTEHTNTYTPTEAQYSEFNTYADEGSAARFFYTAKASQSERNAGLYGFEEIHPSEVTGRKIGSAGAQNSGYAGMTETPRKNIHPTVKPLDLMRYLVRLVTPPNGLCIDPYLGSGTTAIACKLEGFNYIGIEMEEQYHKIAESRVANCDKDNEVIDGLLKNENVMEVYNIFDFIGSD